MDPSSLFQDAEKVRQREEKVKAEIQQVESSLNLDLSLPHSPQPPSDWRQSPQ